MNETRHDQDRYFTECQWYEQIYMCECVKVRVTCEFRSCRVDGWETCPQNASDLIPAYCHTLWLPQQRARNAWAVDRADR